MIVVNVDCHYTQASIANTIFSLGDCVYIKVNGLYFNTVIIRLLRIGDKKEHTPSELSGGIGDQKELITHKHDIEWNSYLVTVNFGFRIFNMRVLPYIGNLIFIEKELSKKEIVPL